MSAVKYYGDLRTLTGHFEERIDADDLATLLDRIGHLYGKNAKALAKASLIVVNGEKVLSIPKVSLNESSEVGFFPMCCGG